MAPKAILVGVGQYPRESIAGASTLRDVPSCETGVLELWKFLCTVLPAEALSAAHVLWTGDAPLANNPIVERPSEDRVKSRFEEGIDEIGDAEPLLIYWTSHGVLPQGNREHRRLFFEDSSSLNGRNLDFEVLVQRLTSDQSRVRSLVVVVDACAMGINKPYWPAGDMVGGAPRLTNQPDMLVLFSASRGESAAAGSSGDPPLYTRLLLAELRRLAEAQPAPPLLDLFREAHRRAARRMLDDLEQLAQDLNIDAKLLPRQLPFEILEWTASGKTRLRPAFDKSVNEGNAIEVAEAWADAYKAYGDEFASTLAQRQVLQPYRQELLAAHGDVWKWWQAGVQRDRKAMLRVWATRLTIAGLLVGATLLGLFFPAARLVADLKSDNNVSQRLQAEWLPIRWLARASLRKTAQDDHDITDVLLRRQHAQHRANCAVALLLERRPTSFLQLLAGDHSDWYDPQARTYAILHAVDNGGVPPRDLLDLLEPLNDENSHASTRQALLLSLGQSQVMLPSDSSFDRTRFEQLLLKFFELDPDPGVHAAALWCHLKKFPTEASRKQLGIVAGKLRTLGVKRLEGSHGSRHWYVDSATGLTMIVLLAEGQELRYGDRDQKNTDGTSCAGTCKIRNSFAISMTEVAQVHVDHAQGAELPISPPLSRLSKPAALDHCKKLGGLQAGTVVVQVGGQSYQFGNFRLPNELEWEFSCRARSFAKFSFGDHEGYNNDILKEYATLAAKSGNPPLMLLKMPNEYGLFDVHGGVAEWCANDFVPYPCDPEQPDVGSSMGVTRPGDGFNTAESNFLSSFARLPWIKDLPPKHDQLGMRVALTVVPVATPSTEAAK